MTRALRAASSLSGDREIETTRIYLETDLIMKERALNIIAPAGSEAPQFKAKDDALAFLPRSDYAQ